MLNLNHKKLDVWKMSVSFVTMRKQTNGNGGWKKAEVNGTRLKTFHLSPLTFYHENGHIRYRLDLFYYNVDEALLASAGMGEEEEFFVG